MVAGPCPFPGARVDSAQIGEGTRIWAGAHVLAGARLGRNCNIGEGCFIENDVEIGDGVVIKNGVCVWERVRLGNHVFIGPEVTFTNDPYPRAHPAFRTGRSGWCPTVVLEGATIGANATVVCGTTIGRWAVVAAGAVVTTDVPANEFWVGIPARRLGWACPCGRRLHDQALQCVCGLAFRVSAGRLALDRGALGDVDDDRRRLVEGILEPVG